MKTTKDLAVGVRVLTPISDRPGVIERIETVPGGYSAPPNTTYHVLLQFPHLRGIYFSPVTMQCRACDLKLADQ